MKAQIKLFNTHVSRVYDLSSERDRNIVEQIRTLYGKNNTEIMEVKHETKEAAKRS